MRPKPAVLLILDGFGLREAADDNAIHHAYTPIFDRLAKSAPSARLETSGEAVGLPIGQMGNSEVGHMNLGTGRIVYQDFTRITKAIDEGDFETNEVLVSACRKAKAQAGTLHILGLLSPGGVHSHEDHIEAMIGLADSLSVPMTRLHAFLDGRDTPPQSAELSLIRFQRLETVHTNYKLSSLCGRHYAMDRDNNWDRIQSAFDLITKSQAEFSAGTAVEGLQQAYHRGETDEFVKATRLGESWEMRPEDIIIVMNFRADRARQITKALTTHSLNEFSRPSWIQEVSVSTLTQYADDLDVRVAFPTEPLTNTLGEVVSNAGLSQLRIAETEKYAHVTFFFSGGQEALFSGEHRELIPSVKVATYDLQPEMSAPEVTDYLVDAISSQKFDLIVCNYANGDMVGHTGNFDAAVKAIEALDQAVGRVLEACESVGGACLITADHGNAEQMLDPDNGQPFTAHTTGPVPIWLGANPVNAVGLSEGALRDVAPTLLALLGLDQPPEMTGRSLLKI
ncbi:MAG: 2,3-bisphosphoglycerate-independent phosphoglycerate mutase [Litorivicinaceae bacterium]|nr:MAG: 2,3-bisphosphoglycerate-independent phosphoglycerate mutase [Litorivicinaceae bacterium]CAI8372572.1 MAG: 2,3-bisphosphoglycerate-independent phosphoglycerate mutase [Gammaproteobacteria bacterium]